MILRKAKISYVFWGLFLILSLYTVLISSVGFSGALGFNGDVLIIGISFAAMIIVSIVASVIAETISNKIHKDPYKISHFMEVILMFFIIVLSFMLRFIYITFIDGQPLGSIDLYKLAANLDYKGAYAISNLDLTFAHFSSMFIQIMGKNPVILMYINSVFQIFNIFIIYYSLKNYIGEFAAIFATGIYAFLPYNIISISQLNAGQLLTFVFLLSFMMVIYVQKKSIDGELTGSQGLFTIVLAGIFGGVAFFFDAGAVALIAFAVVCYLMYKKETFDFVNRTGVKIAGFIAGFVISFLLMFLYAANITGYSYLICLSDYFNKFTKIAFNPIVVAPAYQSIYAPILICFSLIWVLRHFKIERDLGICLVVIPFVLAVMSVLGFTSNAAYQNVTCFWCIMAGIGVVSLSKNSMEYFEREKAKREEQEAKKREKLERQKRELEKKKQELEEKKKVQRDVYTKPVITSVNPVNNNGNAGDKPSISELEASLDFLKKSDASAETPSNVGSVNAAGSVSPAGSVNAAGSANSTGSVNATGAVNSASTANTNASANTAGSANSSSSVSSANSSSSVSSANANAVVHGNALKKEDAAKPATANGNPYLAKTVVNTSDTSEPVKNANSNSAVEPSNTKAANQVTESTSTASRAEDAKRKLEQDMLKSDIIAEIRAESSATVKTINPATKYGKRSDYKTAKVSSSPTVSILSNPAAKNEVAVKKTSVASTSGSSGTAASAASTSSGNNNSANSGSGSGLIHNPLPQPKRKEHIDFEFDIIPSEKDLHFDLVDMKGKDFFDIN